jgi:holo-[acyl-carrier-protein] synthase
MINGIGIDLVKISRIKKLILNYQEKFLNKVFTEKEKIFCEKKANKFQHYAARFAAKEAFFKAIGIGPGKEVYWKDAEVKNTKEGNPMLIFSQNVKQRLKKLRIYKVHLSMTHERDFAISLVILEI